MNKLEPGDRVRTIKGQVITIIGRTPEYMEEKYPLAGWGEVSICEEPDNSHHEAYFFTEDGKFSESDVGTEIHRLNLDFMTTTKFRDAMLALATDPKGKWTDLPEETFLEIAEAVRDYLLLPK
jgi:hypothetical protein